MLHSLHLAQSIKNRLISQQYNEDISGLQEVGHINETVALIFWYFQCFHLMYSEVGWVLVFSRTQVQPQIILEPATFQTIFPFHMTMVVDYKFKCFICPA